MLRFAIRRAFWAIPTLLAISIAVFLMASLVPDPPEPHGRERAEIVARERDRFEAIEEARRERFADLPRFFNATPRDVRDVVRGCVAHLVADDDQAVEAAHVLAETGSAGFPYLLPSLDRLAPAARGRVVAALRPIADRMGVGGDPALVSTDTAALFWERFWEDRAVEFTRPNVRRMVARLVIHASEARERDLIGLDTFALDDLLAALAANDDPEVARRLLVVVAHVTARPSKIGAGAGAVPIAEANADWQRWWFLHRSDFVVLDGFERIGGSVSETRYGKWLLSAARGQLGISTRDGQPVSAKIGARGGVTLSLTVASMLLSYALAVPIGVISAWRRGRALDVSLALCLFVLYSLPTFVFAELFVRSVGSGASMGLPIVAMTLGSLASLSRYQRAAMLDVLRQDYIRTARSKGVSAARLLVVHALRNAMMPTLSLAGLQLPALFGSAIVVEEVFGLPGLGFETMRAVEADDHAWLVAVVLLTAIATTLGLLASDLAYGLLDPRLRERIVKMEAA